MQIAFYAMLHSVLWIFHFNGYALPTIKPNLRDRPPETQLFFERKLLIIITPQYGRNISKFYSNNKFCVFYVKHLAQDNSLYQESRDQSMKKFTQLALYHYVFSQIFDD